MRAQDIMMDIRDYMASYYPMQCRAGEIQQYLNALTGSAYDADEVLRFMNYWSQNNNPAFKKEVINDHAYFKLI